MQVCIMNAPDVPQSNTAFHREFPPLAACDLSPDPAHEGFVGIAPKAFPDSAVMPE
jgi:hypothetical protein